MFASSDTPTSAEWIALIQSDPEQARQQANALKVSIARGGLIVDPALTISLEDYEKAQRLLAKAQQDGETAQRVAHMARVGQATLGAPPSREEWASMIAEDPQFAQAVAGAWQAKLAMVGSRMSRAVIQSVAAYRELVGRQTA
jgi:hypothetical protein